MEELNEKTHTCAVQNKQITLYKQSLTRLRRNLDDQKEAFLKEIVLFKEQAFAHKRLGSAYQGDDSVISDAASNNAHSGDEGEGSDSEDLLDPEKIKERQQKQEEKLKQLTKKFAEEKEYLQSKLTVFSFSLHPHLFTSTLSSSLCRVCLSSVSKTV